MSSEMPPHDIVLVPALLCSQYTHATLASGGAVEAKKTAGGWTSFHMRLEVADCLILR